MISVILSDVRGSEATKRESKDPDNASVVIADSGSSQEAASGLNADCWVLNASLRRHPLSFSLRLWMSAMRRGLLDL